MKILNYIGRNWGIIVYLFLSVFAILPFFNGGFFNIHDNTQIERVYEMSVAIRDGMFPVRWVSDLGYGFGYPIFNFYSVLPYYIGGFLVIAGFSALLSTKLIFVLAIIGSGLSMYILANRFFGNIAAITAAIVYLYFPYHAVNVFVRGDLAELFAYCFLPLVLLGFFDLYYKVEKNKSSKLPILISSIALSLIVLSHNLTAFMLFIFLGIFITWSIIISKNKKRLLFNYFLALVLGFLLSAFYSIPAIAEMGFTNVISQVGGGSDYRDHFICLPQLWNSVWGFGGSAPGCLDGISFKLGKLNIIIVVISFFLFGFTFIKTKKNFLTSYFFVSVILAIFMTLEISSFIWSLPFMDFLQFPWRFLNIVGLFTSLIFAYFIRLILKFYGYKFSLVIASLLIGITLYFNQPLFNAQKIVPLSDINFTSYEHIAWKTSKISDEYLPRGFTKPKSESDIPAEKLEILKGDGKINNVILRNNHISADIVMKGKGEMRVNLAYFPAWNIYIDSSRISYVIKNNGLYFSVPEGQEHIDIKFVQTPVEVAANTLSFIGLVLILIVIISKPRISYLEEKRDE